MSDDVVVLHDAERFRERAKQAREIAHKSKDGGTKRLLIALAENFERMAELATNEMHAAPSQAAAAVGVSVS
jgi:molecular chaperone GrpE (heat shock protein)